MISFAEATDDELKVMREAIDALTRDQPGLIEEDESWFAIVHAVMNEIIARQNMHQLTAERAA